MAKEKLFHVGVKALITNTDGKFLVVETDTSKFITPEQAHGDLIGGRIEIGQDPQDALRREVEEETGITNITAIRLVTSLISPMQLPINDTEKVGLVLMVYSVAIPDNSVIQLSDEHTKFEWLSPNEAAQALEYKFGKEFSDWLRLVGASEPLAQ